MRYFITIAFSLAACFAAQALALRASGGRFTKSESNFFSSIGRIQAGARETPEIMILGSSITGRLPDRANGFAGVANMGCDGGSAADTLRAIDDGLLPRALIIIVEANALQVALRGESEIAMAMRGPWFRVGNAIPLLGADARPSAAFYSPLLAKRTGSFGAPDGEDLGDDSAPIPPDPAWRDLDLPENESKLATELARRIANLRAKGSRVIVAWLPPPRANQEPPAAWIRMMIAESGAEWWDLGQHADPELVQLTDHVHMNAASASRTLRSILRAAESAL
jgi:hypothetical protein